MYVSSEELWRKTEQVIDLFSEGAKRTKSKVKNYNLKERVTRTPPPRVNKAAHSGFET